MPESTPVYTVLQVQLAAMIIGILLVLLTRGTICDLLLTSVSAIGPPPMPPSAPPIPLSSQQ